MQYYVKGGVFYFLVLFVRLGIQICSTLLVVWWKMVGSLVGRKEVWLILGEVWVLLLEQGLFWVSWWAWYHGDLVNLFIAFFVLEKESIKELISLCTLSDVDFSR